ncbi:hypothetical protein H6S82_11315 [Planktothrix sp. FACHB-1355]|uniref:Uncharacterized protein n=1 Tax=Aerosakkonema funiforme FACHB-1375 TaxID=2949571 RepID=A0A926VI93_9CYAN|nr:MULTISPECIES: hypothetical protein [Oscillatoriales]MBD2184390.1 hypothetical protein [Aerosakkonema funiforme FACHB-1375]MBD3559448.1 hypothetical protein [Planktothrix sp. FACHB-1355]
MPQQGQFPTLLRLLSAFLSRSILTVAQQVPPSLTQGSPNQRLNVQRQWGTCPSAVGLWTVLVPYEGGADLTVVVDTRSFRVNVGWGTETVTRNKGDDKACKT